MEEQAYRASQFYYLAKEIEKLCDHKITKSQFYDFVCMEIIRLGYKEEQDEMKDVYTLKEDIRMWESQYPTHEDRCKNTMESCGLLRDVGFSYNEYRKKLEE